MAKIRVLLVDDHSVVRQGLRILLENEQDIEIAGEAKTGREALNKSRELKPDVTVMDIGMPSLNGIQAAQQILKQRPKSPILMFTAHSDPEYVEQVILMGAAGYLIKQDSIEILATAIREVHQGKKFFSPSIHKHLREQYIKSDRNGGLVKNVKNRLTSRESELLQLIAEGSGNKQIASELDISIKTVEKHRQNLMVKLNIHETAGLTRYAMTAGIIEGSMQSDIKRSESKSSRAVKD